MEDVATANASWLVSLTLITIDEPPALPEVHDSGLNDLNFWHDVGQYLKYPSLSS